MKPNILILIMTFFALTARGEGINPRPFLFTDSSCSELREGITLKHIEQCTDEFYKQLAIDMFNGNYNSEFRIQSFSAWMNPDIEAAKHKTLPYSLLDNPTGILAKKGQELVVLLGDTKGADIKIKIQNLAQGYSGKSYSLKEGKNLIMPKKNGLIYVFYHSNEPENKKPINIHFVTGEVNGYFDLAKHDDSDWDRLLRAATHDYFDVVGKYAHLTYTTDMFRKHTKCGTELIELYDLIVYKQQVFMGLEKYNKMFSNRLYFHANKKSNPYATRYRTAYNENRAYIYNADKLRQQAWGPAHEVGHINQTRPGLMWIGMIEVTNNIHSLYIQSILTDEARLLDKKIYSKARIIIETTKNIAFCNIGVLNAKKREWKTDIFCQLVPFWQLYLYCSLAVGNNDFYKDLYEMVRVSPNPKSDGEAQLNFVRYACKASGYNLLEFFEYWGFLTPIEKTIKNYSKERLLKITKTDIKNLKKEIKSQGYKEPKDDIWHITDSNYLHYTTTI